ncbi:MAG: hypothetical protein MJZ19_08445 [Paludibacteraceae bacterium]|nr:hypothetical protein [Paludibacteraceae bacterium]
MKQKLEDGKLNIKYNNVDSPRGGHCTGDELKKYHKSIGNHYNQVYPTNNWIDLYTLNTENGKYGVYFSNKKEAIDWIKENVSDSETANILLSALSQYCKRGNKINRKDGNSEYRFGV